jgi:hypothetical protein
MKREILTLLNHPRLVRTESFGHLGYHHFCLRELENIDQAIIELLGEAYTVPQQEWLRRANRALSWAERQLAILSSLSLHINPVRLTH